MCRERPQQPSSSMAATATDLALLHQANAAAAAGVPGPKPVNTTSTFPMGESFFNLPSSNPYLPASLHKLSSATSTSTADKLKMIQLEAANESMKKMLEKLVTVNADLEGQNAHLIQLVGQLTAENSALKRNMTVGQITTEKGMLKRNIAAISQGLGFPNSQPHVRQSVSSSESAPHQERIPPQNLWMRIPDSQPQVRHTQQQQKKRPRVLADQWSKQP